MATDEEYEELILRACIQFGLAITASIKGSDVSIKKAWAAFARTLIKIGEEN